ncbi:capsule biosynthesis GfcC family protein [Rheinheimera muenzenbergensis]|uniref:Capsule biosynthesis GfcC family protein n=1 Tax=Rheinheimera muenzenbergensis TaxID=1193628 RepID=A0ABU8C2F4_9GAMM
MNKPLLFTLGLLFCSNLSLAKVTVDINGERRQYSEAPRLAEVLQPYALKQQWYWPAAALYRTDSQYAQSLRRELISLAAEIAQQTDDKSLSDALALMQAQVNQWQLAERIVIPLDYDAATVQAALNPRFDAGDYRIVLGRRPGVVHIAGAVKRALSVPHNSASHVAVYAQPDHFSYAADASKLAVVQPDGRIVIAGISSWNSQHVEAMPGAQLLVLFTQPLLDKRFARLNALLQQLAVHRILP